MSLSNAKFTTEQIYDVQHVSDNLVTFKITRPEQFRFVAGQFARLGLYENCAEKSAEQIVWRAFSMVNATHSDYLEFFAVIIPNGKFSNLLVNLKNSDHILLDKHVFGYLTLNRFNDGDNLWMLATGTGVAPFLSILQDFEVWQKFTHIILVYNVRFRQNLAYQELINNLAKLEYIGENGAKLRYLPVISRENSENILNGRITDLLANGMLEKQADLPITPENSRIMICGNPQMVQESLELFKKRDMRLALSRKPGQIAVENYW